MKKFSNIILGLLFIGIGVIIGLNVLDIIDINVFFEGWWTLFIIIPCLVGLIHDKDKTGSIIGIVIGIFLLLCCQDIITFDLFFKMIIPVILVIIGLSIIFKEAIGTKIKKRIEVLNKDLKDQKIISAIFSAQELNYENEEFKGIDLEAVFGGIDIDLSSSIIQEDIVINAKAIFGGIDIIVPKNVNVLVSSTSVFGGVDNDVKNATEEGLITIYINAKCIFGGIDINGK